MKKKKEVKRVVEDKKKKETPKIEIRVVEPIKTTVENTGTTRVQWNTTSTMSTTSGEGEIKCKNCDRPAQEGRQGYCRSCGNDLKIPF